MGLTQSKPDAMLLSFVGFADLWGGAAARERPGGVTL